ncbi:MAG: DNA polymerase III subunit chi [Nitrosomonadaceae bacterium]|nr:DNA polymerase III subunit chi [Nitrosomonadaceae bacterium]
MTEVKFFFNVDHRLQFACKLSKAAMDQGKRLIVYAPEEARAMEFDRLLWAYSPLSFVPHVRAEHALAKETPIVIAHAESVLPHHDALLNLADDPPPYFTRFEFLREVVSTDDEDRAKARERLKFYKARGFEIQIRDMAAAN